MTDIAEAKVECISRLQWHASASDALPFVIQSSFFRRSSNVIASGFVINNVISGSVVFRALPVLNTTSQPSCCTLDTRIAGTVPLPHIDICHMQHPSHEALIVSVTAVSVVGPYLTSPLGTQRTASRFRSLQSSIKRSLMRQWLGMPLQLGACVHAVVASDVVLFRVDGFKMDMDQSSGQSAPSVAIVRHCTSFIVNLERLESSHTAPTLALSSVPSVHRENVTKLWDSIAQAIDPTFHCGHVVVLCGAHGSGKSTLCHQIAIHSDLHVEVVSLATYISPPCGPEASSWTPQIGLRSFDSVASAVLSKRPSAFVIDDFFLFDSCAPAASSILNIIRKMSGQSVCVILCCCQNASIPPEIRSPTQLLRVIDIGSLSTQQRYENFLECVMDIGCSLDEAVDWKDVMKYCSGYTIGDLRRLLVSCSNQHRLCDGHRFLQTIRGSSLACSDIPIEFPSETLDCLAGFCQFRDRLKQLVVNPVVCPVQYRAMGMSLPKGVLLCGPRGSGKTSLVRAAVGSAGAALITVTPSLLYRRYLGESEAAVKSIYAAARSRSPCIVFLDDTDALLASRNSDATDGVGERVLAALLTEIDGLDCSKHDFVFTIGATSRSDAIDPALARPGRLEQCLHLHLPSADDREEILTRLLSKMHIQSSVNLRSLTLLTDGMAVESLVSLCHRAAHFCMERGTSGAISPADFTSAHEMFDK